MRAPQSPLPATCPLVAAPRWGLLPAAPQAHFWLLLLGLLPYPARARGPPCVPFLPFRPHSKTWGCSESLCLTCLRPETKEGMQSKVLGTWARLLGSQARTLFSVPNREALWAPLKGSPASASLP